jgi:hypothetical protein
LQVVGCWMYKTQLGPRHRMLFKISIWNQELYIHASTSPSKKRESWNATLFFPCSLVEMASFYIPSTSTSAECNRNKPLRSTTCLKPLPQHPIVPNSNNIMWEDVVIFKFRATIYKASIGIFVNN